jgi:hypothetical protein
MHHRILITLRLLHNDLANHLDVDTVQDACRHAGHTWQDCQLTPVAILHWIVVQVLNGNTALTHVSLLGARSFTDAAFCLARARVPLAVYRAVLRGFPDALAEGTWHGHRTFLVDGSSFSDGNGPAGGRRRGVRGPPTWRRDAWSPTEETVGGAGSLGWALYSALGWVFCNSSAYAGHVSSM